MKRLLPLVLLTLLLPNYLPGQPAPVFNQQVVVNDRPGIPNTEYEILKVLAAGSNKTVRNTLFTVNTDQTLRNGYSGQTFTFGVKNSPLTISGDIYYRGISVQNELAPISVQFTLRLTASNFTKDFPMSARVKGMKPDDSSVSYHDTSGRSYNFNILDYKLVYNNDNLKALQARTVLINDYYARVQFLDQQFLLLQQIDPHDYGGFRTLFPRLDALQKVHDDITALNFSSSLQLENQDPAQLRQKLSAFNGLLQNKRAEATQVFSTLHLVFYSRGNDAMRDGQYSIARDLYYSALEVNPSFAPAMLQLARIDFIKRDFKEAQCKSDEVLFVLLPDPATRSNTIDLLQNIHEVYLDEGSTNLQYKKYKTALQQFQDAAQMCRRYPGIQCTDEVNRGITNAHKGIYGDILNEARSASAKNDWNTAEKKTEEAYRYFEQNIPGGGEPVEAKELRKAIRQKKYESLLLHGKQFFERGDLEKSVSKYSEADQMQQQEGLVIPSDYDKNSKAAAKAFIDLLLGSGESAVKINSLSEARKNLNRALDIQSQFYLRGETAINKKAEILRGKIYSQECINAQFSADSSLAAGRLFARSSDYLRAMLSLEYGLDVKNRFPDCNIDTDSIASLLYRIRPAGTYLQFMDNSLTAMQNGNYRQSLEYYAKATEYYKQQQVESYGLKHTGDRDEFVIQTGNNGLLNHLAGEEMRNGKLENSLRLYKLLLSRNYDERMISGDLYQLGLKTGVADKQMAPGGKGKKLAARYTGGDKRLKHFEKGFVKGYR